MTTPRPYTQHCFPEKGSKTTEDNAQLGGHTKALLFQQHASPPAPLSRRAAGRPEAHPAAGQEEQERILPPLRPPHTPPGRLPLRTATPHPGTTAPLRLRQPPSGFKASSGGPSTAGCRSWEPLPMRRKQSRAEPCEARKAAQGRAMHEAVQGRTMHAEPCSARPDHRWSSSPARTGRRAGDAPPLRTRTVDTYPPAAERRSLRAASPLPPQNTAVSRSRPTPLPAPRVSRGRPRESKPGDTGPSPCEPPGRWRCAERRP